MKILVICAHYPPFHFGGYEIRCKNVVDLLKQRGHEITIVTNNPMCKNVLPKEDNIFRFLHIQRIGNIFLHLFSDFRDILGLRKIIKEKEPDIIYLWHTGYITRTIFPFLADLKKPVVYDEGGRGLVSAWNNHGTWINFCEKKSKSKLKQFIKITIVFFATKLSCGLLPNKWAWPNKMTAYFNSKYGHNLALDAKIALQESYLVYPGISLDEFPFRLGNPSLKPKITILVPGRIDRIKAIEKALKVLTLLKENINTKDFEMKIVGPVFDAEYYQELLSYISINELKENVSFINQIPHEEMQAIYQSADFCFFPSDQNVGFSRTSLEALATGSLFITSGNEGSAEIIHNGINGYEIPFSKPDLVAEIVIKLINEPSLYESILWDARHEVEENHSLEKYVSTIEKILISAIDF